MLGCAVLTTSGTHDLFILDETPDSWDNWVCLYSTGKHVRVSVCVCLCVFVCVFTFPQKISSGLLMSAWKKQTHEHDSVSDPEPLFSGNVVKEEFRERRADSADSG